MSDTPIYREYIISCRSYEELDSLYDDLETPGGSITIPDRPIDCHLRRPISRNTHYMLTAEEAEIISNDPRVLSVELTLEELGGKITPFYTITSTAWSKTGTHSDTDRNWGFYRCVNKVATANWGSDGTSTALSGTVQLTNSGKNVDVVIVDGCIDPAHPEFAVNTDGTGGSRVNQFNWFSLNPTVTGGAAGTYTYTPYATGSTQQQSDNNHGCHVAGTVAGNRRGWAKDASIYNINPYSTAPSTIASSLLIDYIRAWHNSKAVNPTTGKKNPTVTNHSYGGSFSLAISAVTEVIYRGTTYTSGFTSAQLSAWGLPNDGTTINNIPVPSSAAAQDIADAINDGIIFVAAAGNSNFKADISGGVDYNNRVNGNYYNQGSRPSCLPNVLCVGAIDATVTEQRATFTNVGPRVDVYGPGVNITSSVHNGQITATQTYTPANDSRNTTYKIGKYQGTSMASPEVCGIVACLAEQWPRMNQYEVLAYFNRASNAWANTYLSVANQITDTGVSTRTWSVTATGASAYTFSGFSSGNNITISATEGTILTFNVSATGHPFWIKTSQVTGTGSGVTTGTITNNGSQSGTVTWNTRGVTPGTYYYICEIHSAMTGTITITADTSNRSLQGSVNRYLAYNSPRKIPNPTGTTYIGAQTTSQQPWPRLNNKFRPILTDGNIDSSVYNSSMVYPRHPIWHRKLT